MSSIEIDSVTKRYGSIYALNNVSMAVKPGSLTAVLGPSGSGKTTMLSIIAGISRPSSGTVSIAGNDVTSLPSAYRNVGLVFQSYALFPHLSVFENVAFPLRVRRQPGAEVSRSVLGALDRVRLAGLADRKPSQLSGGQQQRVAVARAIVFQPNVLLLDEPLAALDRKLREEVRLEIRHLQRELGITTLLVTHDQDEAMSMADEIVVMAEGCIQQIDTPEGAYHHPTNEFVARFLGIANIFRGVLEAENNRRFIRLDGGDRVSVPFDAAGRVGDSVFGMLRPEQISVVDPATTGSIGGQVDELIFLGESVRYLIKTDQGYIFTVMIAHPKNRIRRGDRVGLAWEPSDVWMLPGRSRSRKQSAPVADHKEPQSHGEETLTWIEQVR